MSAVTRRPVLSVAALAVIAVVAGLLVLATCPGSAYAAPRFDTAKSPQVVVFNSAFDESSDANQTELRAPKGENDLSNNLTKCKSSNESVLKVAYIFSNSIQFTMKGVGTATVTLKYKGKTYKIKYDVKKYVNPVKTLKIGKSNYASEFKKTNYSVDNAGKLKGKLNVVPAKNWTLKSAELGYYTKGLNYKTKTVKNGAKINGVYLTLTLKNKKTKAVEKLFIDADTDMD